MPANLQSQHLRTTALLFLKINSEFDVEAWRSHKNIREQKLVWPQISSASEIKFMIAPSEVTLILLGAKPRPSNQIKKMITNKLAGQLCARSSQRELFCFR
jgi:hypothetical protein